MSNALKFPFLKCWHLHCLFPLCSVCSVNIILYQRVHFHIIHVTQVYMELILDV